MSSDPAAHSRPTADTSTAGGGNAGAGPHGATPTAGNQSEAVPHAGATGGTPPISDGGGEPAGAAGSSATDDDTHGGAAGAFGAAGASEVHSSPGGEGGSGAMPSAGSGEIPSDGEAGGASGASGAEPTPACELKQPFGWATPLPGLPVGSARARLSEDELVVYYALELGRDRSWDMVVATRADLGATFGAVELLANANGPAMDFSPSLSGNGLELYFESIVNAEFHLFHSSRARSNDDFGAPEMVEGLGDTQEGGPFVSLDGSDLYFHAYRDGVQRVLHSARVGAGFATPSALELAAPSYAEGFPVVSSDGLSVYFASGQPGGVGGWDIWMASRTTTAERFEGAVNLSALNTPHDEFPSSVAADHCRLYFERTGPNWVDSQVYVARR